MDQSILQLAGAMPQKQPRFVPLGTHRMFTGLVTSRSPLQEPGTRAEARFYGGRPDTLWDGLNIELSVNNTYIRRPGHSLVCTLPSPALAFYTYRSPTQAIKVLADTATGVYDITSTPSLVFTKSTGAGQTYFQTVGTQVFMTDGTDLKKWDGTTLTNWGIAAPSSAPTLQIKGGAGPAAPTLSVTAGGTLTGQGTLYVRTTFVTPYGETQGSSEAYIAVPDNNELVVAYPSNPPSNATGWNCYIGKSAGGEQLQNSSAIALNVNYTLISTPSITGPVPPGSSNGTYNIYSTLGVSYVYCFGNSKTAHVSTASPVSAYSGPQTSVNIQLTGNGSTDPQVDQVQIYRTTDGGAIYMLLATISNPGSGTWSYTDTGTPDANLNSLLLAPQAMANNPPPSGLQNLAFFGGCIWGSVNNYLYFSSGPLTTNGSGNEAWPPLNYALLPSKITALVPYPNGLLIFTVDDTYYTVAPGATPAIFQAGLGTLSYNNVTSNGSTIYVFTTDQNLVAITPGAGVVDIGFNIADKFSSINGTSSYLTHHISGHKDKALFLCSGSGNIWRCNPNQQPEGGATWSTMSTIAAGATAMCSVESSAGVHRLYVASGNNVLFRDWTVNTDNGATYEAWGVIGSLVLALPGEVCQVQSITIESMRTGSQPSLSVLLGEISGTFESLPSSVPDPPHLPESQTLYSDRYYLNQSQNPVVCRHLQLKFDFNTDNSPNELLSYSVYGALHVEA